MPNEGRYILAALTIGTCGLGFILWGTLELVFYLWDKKTETVSMMESIGKVRNPVRPEKSVPLPQYIPNNIAPPTDDDADDFKMREWNSES